MKLRRNAKRIGASLTVLAGVAGAVLASTAGPAVAATPSDVSVRAGAVTMRPASGGGYAGSASIQISYTGPAGASASVTVAAPEGLYLQVPADSPLLGCGFMDRFTLVCGLVGDLVDGQTRDVRLEFAALAAPARRTRPTLAGSVSVTAQKFGEELVETTPADNTARLRGVLVGTGPGFDPRPYRPADTYDLSAAAASDTIAFAPDAEDGQGYVGTATLTLRTGTDAYHQDLMVSLAGLAGLESMEISPVQPCVGGPSEWTCRASDGPLPQGRSRTVTLTVRTTGLPAAGTPVRFQADTNVGGTAAVDANPADNVATVTVA